MKLNAADCTAPTRDLTELAARPVCVAGAPGEIGVGLQARWGGLVDQILLGVDFWLRHADNPEWGEATRLLQAGA